MRFRQRRGVSLLLIGILGLLAGCRGPETLGGTGTISGNGAAIAPAAADGQRGLLLRTGSIQLGPGVGKNLWGWQGDGLSGF